MVTENLKKVEEKIEKACERSGRSRICFGGCSYYGGRIFN